MTVMSNLKQRSDYYNYHQRTLGTFIGDVPPGRAAPDPGRPADVGRHADEPVRHHGCDGGDLHIPGQRLAARRQLDVCARPGRPALLRGRPHHRHRGPAAIVRRDAGPCQADAGQLHGADRGAGAHARLVEGHVGDQGRVMPRRVIVPVATDRNIPAEEGVVVVVEILTNKSTYNTLELTSGRMAKVGKGDIVAGALGHRKALFGYSGHVPESVKPGDISADAQHRRRARRVRLGQPRQGQTVRLPRHRWCTQFPLSRRTHRRARACGLSLKFDPHAALSTRGRPRGCARGHLHATTEPVPFFNRQLYVPDLVAGRLVETPTNIDAQLDAFVAGTTPGHLHPATALTTGYDACPTVLGT